MTTTTYILVVDPATSCYLRDTARFPNPDADSPIAYTTYFKAQAKRFATFAEAQDACPRGWPASRVVTEVTEAPAPALESNDQAADLVTVVVLNDGRTFTDIHGCYLCVVRADQYYQVIANGGDARDLNPVTSTRITG